MAFLSPPHTQFADPTIVLSHFIRQIESQHIQTSTQDPAMLHFDANTRGLVEYGWPIHSVTEERVPPNQLEAHRRSHEFRGPSCLCAFLESKGYTEAEIGIVEVGNAGEEGNQSVLNGEYVAICAKRRCGFFSKPLALDRLVHVSDVGKAYRRGDGLFQIMPDVVARGRIGGLQSVDPEEVKAVKAKTVANLMLGMSEDVFWSTFVQCLGCKQVQFRQHYALNHRCRSPDIHPSRADDPPRHHPYRHSQHQHRRREYIHAHLSTLIGDNPAQNPIRAIPIRTRHAASAARTGRNSLEWDEDGYESSDYVLTDVSGAHYGSPKSENAFGTLSSDDTLPTIPQLLFGGSNVDRVSGTKGNVTPCSNDRAANESGSDSEDHPVSQIQDWEGEEESIGSCDTDDSGEVGDTENTSSGGATSDDLGSPAARTSDMEKWPSHYDEMHDAIARINGPQMS